MKKCNEEQEKLFVMLAEEAEKDIEKNGTISWEEFWKFAEKLEKNERKERRYTKQNTIQLRLATWLGKTSKRFIKV